MKPKFEIWRHLGLVLVLAAYIFRIPFFREATMTVTAFDARQYAMTAEGKPVALPFSVRLVEFKTDFYEDGCTPKQFSSTIDVDGRELVTSVNHPCYHKGWMIYQSGYDESNPYVSTLEMVRDPLLPVLLVGFVLMAAGAFLSFRKVWKSRFVLPAAALLAVIFGFISLARVNLGTLPPALRSLWFAPHIIFYMLAYAALAISLIFSVLALFRKNSGEVGRLSVNLLCNASSLMLLGMLCGAVWAKLAWGDYWTWDPKETCAGITWLVTVAGLHLPKDNRKLMFVVILLAFFAMQITWYGLDMIPSARASMHLYNMGG